MTKNIMYKEQFKRYGKPMIIRSMFNSLMMTADKLIAALFIGASALVATTLVSPLMFLMAAFAMFFITGLGAYVGLLIGRDEVEKANALSSGIILLMASIGFIMMGLSLVFAENFAHFLGARGEFYQLSVDYLRIFSLSFPLLLTARGLDVLILNDGDPQYSFKLNIVASISNLLLNLFAVGILGLGIKGLAGATVIAIGIEFFGGLWYFLKKSKLLHIRKPSLNIKTTLRIVYNGFSDFAMMVVEAITVFVINIAFVNYLTPNHFEAYATVSIIITLFYGIYMGASGGLQPLFSQMMGRGEFENLLGLAHYSVLKTFKLGVLMYIALIPFIEPLLGFFIEGAETIAIGKFFFLTIGAATLLSNYPLQMTFFFTAINRPLESAFISVMRTLILIPPAMYFLVMILGASGVAIAYVLADGIMIIGLMIFMKKIDLSKLHVAA